MVFNSVVFAVGGKVGFFELFTLFKLVPVGPTVLDGVMF